jgi:HlyD family secretion protein
MKKNIIIAVAIVALVSLAYFKSQGSREATKVNIATAEVQEIKSSILASGTLIYKEQVQLRSEVIGQVSEVLIEEGDSVSQGQILMRLEPRTFNADVEQQSAYVRIQTIAIERQQKQLENIASQWQRNLNLYERKMIGQDAFELVENQYALAKIDLRSREEALLQAQATLDKALERLEKTVFRSPINGVATSVDIKVGETAISGTTNIAGSNLITVADPSSILVEVEVDEADIANVSIDQKADIFAVAFPDKALVGEVQSIATSAKRTDRRQGLSFTVKILLDDAEDIDIRPGMSCRAEIYTSVKGNKVAVPIEAIIYKELSDDEPEVATEQDSNSISISAADSSSSNTYVFIMVNGEAVKRDVELGISNDQLQEIIAGLDAGDQVITGPARVLAKLDQGSAVQEIEKKDQ